MTDFQLCREIREKINHFHFELQSVDTKSDEYDIFSAIYEAVSQEARALTDNVEADLSVVYQLEWFNVNSIVELAEEIEKPESTTKSCAQCDSARMSICEGIYVCDDCSYTSGYATVKTSGSKSRSSTDRSIRQYDDWMNCLMGCEMLPKVVDDLIDDMRESLEAKGFTSENRPSINQMRQTFSEFGLQSKYKHCVNVIGVIFNYRPRHISETDREAMRNMFLIISRGFEELRKDRRVTNIRYIPTIIEWIIYSNGDWIRDYSSFLACIPQKGPKTMRDIYKMVAEIWENHDLMQDD